ncbi:MAG: SUMF1/EgtB/PvdO family nonheme iron enzyme [Spirochaetaceae bacterium]|nr:SUMF1/EgtB/PvdO family nonheme iron enzyme [Spirochaetaceae bacterium]
MKHFSKSFVKLFCIFAIAVVTIFPLTAQSGTKNAYGLFYDPNAVIDLSKDGTYFESINNSAFRAFFDGDFVTFHPNYNLAVLSGKYDWKNQCWIEFANEMKYNYIDITQLYKSIDLTKTNLNRDTSGKIVCYVYDQYYQFPQIAPGTARSTNKTVIRVDTTKNTRADGMVYVEGGTFDMGNPNDTYGFETVHSVTVNSFCISDHEVTQAEYNAIMGKNPSEHQGDNKPVENVSWYDAVVYCNKRSVAEKLTPCYSYNGTTDSNKWGSDFTSSAKDIECNWNANGYRLPTEAEWEFAARGGNYSQGYEYSGSDSLGLVAWCDFTCQRETQDVMLLRPNELYIYDMAGNVSEWCWDWYENYSSSSQKNPKGPSSGTYRTMRGGSCVDADFNSKVYYRLPFGADKKEYYAGFRVARNGFYIAPEAQTYMRVQVDEGFVFVEGGGFGMGRLNNDNKAHANAAILDSFFMSDHEVTMAEYAAITGNAVVLKEIGNQPMVNVSWYEALDYCNKRSIAEGFTPCYSLNGETDISKWGDNWDGSVYRWDYVVCDWNADGYRLPTSTEWQYAAHGGKNAIRYEYAMSGSALYSYDGVAWYKKNSDGYAHDVKTKLPNELEIYDMSGNVGEWCWDWFGDIEGEESPINPTGPIHGVYRIVHGGNYKSAEPSVNLYGIGLGSDTRLEPRKRDDQTGFRVVRNYGERTEKPVNITASESDSDQNKSAMFVYVRGGTFNMGKPDGTSSQTPVHTVTIDSFYICAHEVTQAEYRAVMGVNPSEFIGDNRPVENVSWLKAIEYCNKRSIAEGLTPCYSNDGDTCDWTANGYRLPTEAEWEYAARGANYSKGFKYIGSDDADAVSWYLSNSEKRTQDVMTKKANEIGLYDMGGNVAEWCWDGYSDYTDEWMKNPKGTYDGRKVIRGGSWRSGYSYYQPVLDAYYRESNYFTAAFNTYGLRVVRNAFDGTKRNVSDSDLAKNVTETAEIVTDDEGNVFVQGGYFDMGTTEELLTVGSGDSLSYAKLEDPMHGAMVSSFYISDHEVTQSEYRNIMGKTAGSYTGANKPVVNVSWLDAVEYCNALSKKKGLTPCYVINGNNVTCYWNANGYRLPTESEWEFAARGGKNTKNFEFSGSDYIERVAWYGENSGYAAHDVRTSEPNELGLYDMTGNVGEWVWDVFSDYGEETVYNYRGLATGMYRVVRGGNYGSAEYECLNWYRDSYELRDKSNQIGFRVVRNAELDPGLVYVKGGAFSMGGKFERVPGALRVDAEKPIHTVNLTSFYICDHEVTQLEYAEVMGTNPCEYPANKENDRSNCPVESVNWYDAVEYCNRRSIVEGLKPCYSLNGETNPDKWGDKGTSWDSNVSRWDNVVCDWNATGYRLPTDAEWEYAARGGNQSKNYTYSGSNDLGEVAWIRGNSGNWANEVKAKLPNELGLYDMSGNVKEWVWDRYEEYSGDTEYDPTGAESGNLRVVRNYSFDYGEEEAFRVFVRDCYSPIWTQRTLGFRVARSSGEPRATQPVKTSKPTTTGFVLVQGGTFKMGSTNGEKDEKPVHSVTLSSFYMCDHEVTQAEYKAVTGSNPSYFSGNNKPVEQVSWYDAIEYCNALSRKEGLKPCYTSSNGVYTCDWTANGYRLPTEAEWEYAARGGNKSKDYKYSGGNAAGNVAWSKDNSSSTHDVKSKNANELGLYDMSGNVAEWCWDWYGSYGSTSSTNPKGASSGSYRARRGGSWSDASSATSVTYRDGNSPNRTANNRGFRVVRNAE